MATTVRARRNNAWSIATSLLLLSLLGTAAAARAATFSLETQALTEGSASGSDAVALDVSPAGAAWTASAVDSWLHLTPANSSGTGSAVIQFAYDANPSATGRTGTLSIQGITLTVTQAGTSYVPANPLSALVASGLSEPYGVAVDGAGNLYIANLGLQAVVKWTAATQVTSDLIAGLNQPRGVALDAAGNVYVADEGADTVYLWTAATQTTTTLIGTGLNLPRGVAVDGSGNVYVANFGNSTITMWTAATQTAATLLSTGLNQPSGVAVDGAGNLYISDFGTDSIKKWTAATQTLSTLIGAGLSGPIGVALDASGNVFIADTTDNAIKKYTVAAQLETTVVQTSIIAVQGVAVDNLGNVYITDSGLSDVYESSGAFVGPVALTEGSPAGTDQLLPVLPATTRLTGTNIPTSNQSFLTIGATANGIVHFSFTANPLLHNRTASITALGQPVVITQKSLATANLESLPPGAVGVLYNDSVTATVNGGTGALTLTVSSFLAGGTGLAAPSVSSNTLSFNSTPKAAGAVSFNLTIKDSLGASVLQNYAFAIVAPAYSLETQALIAGAARGSGSVSLDVTAYNAAWTAASNDSWLHISNGSISGAGSALVVFTYDANPNVAIRTGTLGIQGRTLTVTQAGTSHIPASSLTTLISAGLNLPSGLATDGSNNVYIADSNNLEVKDWSLTGQFSTTFIGPESTYFEGVAVDGAGNIYIADTFNNTVDKWSSATQQVTTLVAGLLQPCGVAVDSAGNLYIADSGHNEIKKYNATTHVLTTIVGTGVTYPRGIAVDGAGNVYIADSYNNSVKKWSVATETVSTLALINLSYCEGVAVDGSGNVYISDYGNSAVEKWTAATQSLSTLVGTGLSHPFGVAVDALGNVYIDDYGNNAFKQTPQAFIGPAALTESSAAGSDSLLPVLRTTTTLSGLFAPSSDQAWLSIGSVSGGTIGFSFTANGTGVSRVANITVLGQQIPVTQKSISITPAALPASTAGLLYNHVISASGGVGNKTMAVSNYSDGGSGLAAPTAAVNTLTFNATPTAAGTVSFDLTATDTGNNTETQHYSFVINAAVALNPAVLPLGTVGVLYNQVVTGTGGTGAESMVLGNFNAGGTGLSAPAIAPNTVTFNSTPTTGGTVSFDLTATDTLGANAMLHYSFTVKIGAAYSNLSAPTLPYGSATTVLAGTLSNGNSIPTGSVSIVLDGVTQLAAINAADGSFSSSFATASLGVSASPYVIAYSYIGDATFNPANDSSKTLIVTPLPLSVTGLSAVNKIYDGTTGAVLSGSGVLSGILPADSANVALTGTPVGAFSDKNAGNAKAVNVTGLSLSGSAAANYTLTPPAATANIAPAPLTVTANAVSSVYGSAPAFTVSYATLASGDSAASLGGTLAFTTLATLASPVGKYAVTPAGVTSANYTITFASGTLTIVPAPLTITANPSTRVYAAANPAFSAGYATFVNGDTAANLGGTLIFSTLANSASSVGIFPVTPSGATSSNYTITFVPGNLTIVPAPLTVSGLVASDKVYDGTATAMLTGPATLAGVAAGDAASVSFGSPDVGAFADKNAGTGIAVTVTGLTLTGLKSADYTLTPPALTANIAPAPLTVTANAATSVFGAALPSFTASFATFVNGETAANLSGTLAFATSATASSAAGVYAVTPGGVTSSNYAIAFVAGNLTITAVPPAVTSGLGASVPAGLSGLPVQFSFSVADTLPVTYVWTWGDGTSTTTSSTSLSHVYTLPGTYTVQVTATDSANLSVSAPAMAFTVTPAGLCDGLTVTTCGSQQLSVKLAFPSGGNKDSLTLKGILTLPDGFAPLGQVVQWQIAGIAGMGTLDANGKLTPKSSTVQASLSFKKPAKGANFTARSATFTLVLKGQSLSNTLQLTGIPALNQNSANSKGDAGGADICVVLKGTQGYQESVTGTYLGKKGKSGAFSVKAK